MAYLLHEDRDSRVEREDGLVKKIVYRANHSGLRRDVPSTEMVEREARALEMVADIPHVQRLVRRGDTPDSFYSEYIPGIHLAKYPEKLPEEFFDELQKSLRLCRRKGVYRLDRFLHAQRDILVRPDLTPGIIDFGDVLFLDDPRARIPGMKSLLEVYGFVQVSHLRRTYQYNPG
ncbi:MAG: hypothetical protein AABY13_00415 [Nanoarchaeota archaeon]